MRCFVLNIRQTQIQCVWESEMWKINEAEIPCYKANYFSLQWNILGFPRLTDLFRTEPRNFPNCAYFAHFHWMSFKRAETSSRIPNCKIMPPHSYLLCSYGWKDSTWNPLGNEHWFTPPPPWVSLWASGLQSNCSIKKVQYMSHCSVILQLSLNKYWCIFNWQKIKIKQPPP